MTINSRQKGAGAEREFAGLIRDLANVRLIRNLEQSRAGGHDLIVHPDEAGITAESFRRLAIECKRYQTATDAQIRKWWNQAVLQADQAGPIPILGYRADRAPWRVVVPICYINSSLGHHWQLEYTATLSAEGFCLAVRESS